MVGAAIWVGNGTVAIIAVQKAGLSIAQALWSGLSIFVGFVWGAFVFNEPVTDLSMSFLALLLMVRFFLVSPPPKTLSLSLSLFLLLFSRATTDV